ncbi:MAG: hypothetical protein AB8B99_16080 [Phormidesmis sp.]
MNHSASLSTLDTNDDLTLVSKLHEEGVMMTSIDAFDAATASVFLTQAAQLQDSLVRPTDVNKYGRPYLLATPSQVTQYPEMFLFGLNERLLKIAENYLGLPVAYHGMYFHRDFANVAPTKSKLWHLDMEDYRTLKVVIYLNDITNDTYGPLQYISKQMTKLVVNKTGHQYGYINDALMRKHLSGMEWKSCLGPSGTMIFMDTATLLHRGKVPSATDRFAVFFDYTSQYPKRPYYCKSSLPNSTLKAMAEKVSNAQKNCLLWRHASSSMK